jgi:alanine-glyoxylate transaminase / serine-glyoxylate transaminase / serine-pyruvate transaminase
MEPIFALRACRATATAGRSPSLFHHQSLSLSPLSPFTRRPQFSKPALGVSPARLLHRPSRIQSHPESPTVKFPVTSSSAGRFFKLASSRSRPYYSRAAGRLSLISRHLEEHQQSPFPPINTPYTTERDSLPSDDIPWNPLSPPDPRQISPSRVQTRQFSTTASANMSSQPSHASLLIPGPIEISDEVSQAMSHYAQSHVGQPFVNTFGDVLAQLRKLFQTSNPNSQPFVLAGSGTLGWDLVAANLVEPGEDVLVLHTGYFGDSFADCLSTYGAKPKQLKAPIGGTPQLSEIEAALKEKKYKALTVTHVDTSTGVLSQIQPLADLIKRVSPETLLIVDGVCSVGAEEIDFDKMGIDACLTASQKAIGCPPGLSIMMVSEKAMNVFNSRKSPPGSYYASFKNWTPVMKKYEAKQPLYFATPPTQLVQALHTSLTAILARPLAERFAEHAKVSDHVKAKVKELGLKELALEPANAAHTMTAIYLPEGMAPPEILPKLMSRGVIFAGGLHKEIASKYIRFGHMGVSVTDGSRGEIDKALEALKEGLAEVQQKK